MMTGCLRLRTGVAGALWLALAGGMAQGQVLPGVPATGAVPAVAAASAAGALPLSAQLAPASTVLTRGEVRKVDATTGKVTLRHGPITPLGMPAMTMVFTARDPALLAGLAPGDSVDFAAAHEAGTYWVTAVQPVR